MHISVAIMSIVYFTMSPQKNLFSKVPASKQITVLGEFPNSTMISESRLMHAVKPVSKSGTTRELGKVPIKTVYNGDWETGPGRRLMGTMKPISKSEKSEELPNVTTETVHGKELGTIPECKLISILQPIPDSGTIQELFGDETIDREYTQSWGFQTKSLPGKERDFWTTIAFLVISGISIPICLLQSVMILLVKLFCMIKGRKVCDGASTEYPFKMETHEETCCKSFKGVVPRSDGGHVKASGEKQDDNNVDDELLNQREKANGPREGHAEQNTKMQAKFYTQRIAVEWPVEGRVKIYGQNLGSNTLRAVDDCDVTKTQSLAASHAQRGTEEVDNVREKTEAMRNEKRSGEYNVDNIDTDRNTVQSNGGNDVELRTTLCGLAREGNELQISSENQEKLGHVGTSSSRIQAEIERLTRAILGHNGAQANPKTETNTEQNVDERHARKPSQTLHTSTIQSKTAVRRKSGIRPVESSVGPQKGKPHSSDSQNESLNKRGTIQTRGNAKGKLGLEKSTLTKSNLRPKNPVRLN
jgi:hypothetical protein